MLLALAILIADIPPATPDWVIRPTVSTIEWPKEVKFGHLVVSGKSPFAQRIRSEFARLHPLEGKGGGLPVKIKPSPKPGFRLEVQKGLVTLEATDDFALAAYFLARLTGYDDEYWKLPGGVYECRPKVAWRGVHLFVGPTALDFHKKLWQRVLIPLGYNKVVLQCEQTEWNCLPNLRGGIAMKRTDLAKLCDWYRSVGVEPIPLVQSFGHAEWLFRNKANLDIAMNPKDPYAMDPRKPRVRKLMAQLWSEVIQVTKAKTIHFGLDEVDLKGFPKKDPALVTKLWRIQVPMLAQIAKKHRVKMMLWGDEMLAPGQGPDATNAPTWEMAAARRAVVPKGAMIADWHYRRDANPALFAASLALLKKEGFAPIAATWYKPENIFGFASAAIDQSCGLLQTTWAGYESSEAAMNKAIPQFGAMVIAADYAWGGAYEINYEPDDVFRKLYRRK